MSEGQQRGDLLDRAGKAFALAGKLGRAFHEEHQQQRGQIDAAGWNRHAPTFNAFCEALLQLRDAMQNPPDGFAPVAVRLLEAARVAKGIRDAMQRPDGRTWAAYLEFFPALNSVAEDGWRAVKEVTKTRRLDDPFAFVAEPGGDDAAKQPFSLLDRFPATPAGHVAFVESVRDEVHNAAEAKRQQSARNYADATVASTVRAVHWDEARRRVAALCDLPADAVEQVARVLRRELTVGTVEQIDGLLTPAVVGLRDALERARDSGDLAAALDSAVFAEHADRNEQTRQFWIQVCGMPANLTYEEGTAWAREQQLRQDSAESAHRDKVTALERLVESRCRERLLAAGFRDDELQGGSHVRCLPRYVDGSDPRMEAYKAVMQHLQCEQQAMFRVLGCQPAPSEIHAEQSVADAENGTAEPTDIAPTAQKTKRGTERGEAENPGEKLAALQPAERKAYFVFLAAERQAGKRLEDREAYDRLKEQGLPDHAGDLGELTDYVLPAFDTWSRQLRAARRVLGENKYSRRAGRRTGSSIIKANELE